MCDKNHNHGLVETWVTPINSLRLKSKLVQLAPGQFMPPHTTGPGREEVITCIFGSVEVMTRKDGACMADTNFQTLTAGQACFIPENTLHAINNREEDHALYSFVVTLSDEQRQAERLDMALAQAWA